MGLFTETLEEFYRQKYNAVPEGFGWTKAHFNIFRLEDSLGQNRRHPVKFTRKEFYKIALVRGESVFDYGEERFLTSGSSLVFFNPVVPYTWQPLNKGVTGFFCIFNDAFFADNLHTTLRDLPMFMPGHRPLYELGEAGCVDLERIFGKMLADLASSYRMKYDLIRTYILEILHMALKMESDGNPAPHTNANARITSSFIALLERQFPIETPHQPFSLRSPGEFALRLSMHVNHLNRAIRETTGKTTSNLIRERIVAEAKALLKHTNWNITEISQSLGFEDIAHFGNFFKKETAVTPTAYRMMQ